MGFSIMLCTGHGTAGRTHDCTAWPPPPTRRRAQGSDDRYGRPRAARAHRAHGQKDRQGLGRDPQGSAGGWARRDGAKGPQVKSNRYIRNGDVQVSVIDGMRWTCLYGDVCSDPKSDLFGMWGMRVGRSNELVFHIAGSTFYPTNKGYVSFGNQPWRPK